MPNDDKNDKITTMMMAWLKLPLEWCYVDDYCK